MGGNSAIIGIDPGNSGAIVILRKLNGVWTLTRCFRLSSGEQAIAAFLRTEAMMGSFGPTICYLEKVWGWGEGRSFNFGMFYGFVRGVLYSCGLTTENGYLVDVIPQKWMKEMGVVPQKGEKAKHRQNMRQLAGEIQNEIKPTNWNAAGILIAYYGLKMEEEIKS